MAAALVIVAVAIGAARAVPAVAVFLLVVALNLVLGGSENVPFSTFPMFSQPRERDWSLRFEDPDGVMVPIGGMGVNPVLAKKRFATEVQNEAPRGAGDLLAARRRAARVIADQIEKRRPARGPLASAAITVILVEYSVESGSLIQVCTPLVDSTPT